MFAQAENTPVDDPLTARDGQYTIAWMSDTQRYSRDYPQIFLGMTRFLRENREQLNLGYVVHTGDIVSNAKKTPQWENARAAMDELKDIPHGVLAGNHDRRSATNYKDYSQYFGEQAFSDYPYYGGSWLDNQGHYDLITLGSTDFIFVYLSYHPDDEAVAWAGEAFARYPERVGVLCVHDYLNANTTLSSTGKKLNREVVAKNPNVYLVLSGHRHHEDMLVDYFDDTGDGVAERIVYQMIANYQGLNRGGEGFIRFLQIDEEAGLIRLFTYSPVIDEFRAPPKTAKNPAAEIKIPWRIGE